MEHQDPEILVDQLLTQCGLERTLLAMINRLRQVYDGQYYIRIAIEGFEDILHTYRGRYLELTTCDGTKLEAIKNCCIDYDTQK